ncbi:MAG: HPr(Ser) kinase/phosphatase [Gemmatimonadales bacterium]
MTAPQPPSPPPASAPPRLKVGDLLARKGDPLQLELLTGEVGLEREIRSPEASSPGLVLAGYTARFVGTDRIHILGETEITYLASLDAKARRTSIETFLAYSLPCIIITKGQEAPEELLVFAREKGIPVIRTRLKTAEFYRRLKPFLDDAFAPRTTVHGSLADVFGVGLLFRGRSGIGKSECVLDLVERGHRLVADDVVHITRRGHDVLIGRGHEISRHYMEIRGVGLIDINALFGIRSVRQQKRIEVVVQLEDWDTAREYDRTGLDQQRTELLDVELPLVTVPLNPGKNLTVICEVVAMNHLLRYSGVDSANVFNERLIRRMREKGAVQQYLEEDYE